MIIRVATLGDFETLQKMGDELVKDNSQHDKDIVTDWAMTDSGQTYYKEGINNKEGLMLIAEVDGKGAGYIYGVPKTISYRKSKYFEIESIAVNPGYRGKGIGAALIKEMKIWAKKNNYQRLFVNSYFNNTQAIAFYKRSGFTEIDLCLETDL